MKSEKDLDNFFKKGLQGPADEIPFNEGHWDALEQMLDKRKKREGFVLWSRIAGGIAAVLLLFIGWWFFAPWQKQVPANVTARTPARQLPDHKVQEKQDNNNSIVQLRPNAHSNPSLPVSVLTDNTMLTDRPIAQLPPEEIIQLPPGPPIGSLYAKKLVDFVPVNDIVGVVTIKTVKERAEPVKEKALVQEKVNAALISHPQLTLSIIASSDLNGVNSFEQSKIGGNFGALFSVGVKKFTLTTGVIYSIKPYTAEFEYYHTRRNFAENPLSVTADCQMLDVPVNLGYQVFKDQRNKIAVGAGLSSYFMLYENYKYNYSSNFATGPQSYTVPNSKNYLFGVLNLNATIERQISSKLGIAIQPYLKVPLRSIGYGEVKLQSAGVAVGFNWRIK